MEKFNEQKTKFKKSDNVSSLGILITSSGELEVVNVVIQQLGLWLLVLQPCVGGSIMFHKNEKVWIKIKLIRRRSLLLFSNLKFI